MNERAKRMGFLDMLVLALLLCGCTTGSTTSIGGSAEGAPNGGQGDGGASNNHSPWAPTDPPPTTYPECEATGDARCWYVATNGDDSHDGSIEAPVFRIQEAVSRARPGDFIYLRGGTYGQERRVAFKQGNCGGDIAYALIVLRDVTAYCSGVETYAVANGTDQSPITIKAFTGEKPVLNGEGMYYSIFVGRKSHWVIEGLEITKSPIEIWGGNQDGHAHDIMLRGNEIHDVTRGGGANIGLIRINRGDWGGAYNIFIEHNHLYDLKDEGTTRWDQTDDAQHFGSVTTLSCIPYISPDCGGTSSIYVRQNRIHDIPAAFFLKNPGPGPVEIMGNVVSNAQYMGNYAMSNVRFEHNLIYNVHGAMRLGGGASPRPGEVEYHGNNFSIRHNTFIDTGGIGQILAGVGHSIEHNVVFGLYARVQGANWDTGTFLGKDAIAIQRDPTRYDASDPRESLLQTVTSDNNCLISPYADFVAAKRIMLGAATGEGSTRLEHYTLEEAGEMFGFDQSSVVIQTDDPADVFVDPANHDYTLKPGSPCAGKGATL